MGTVPYDLHKYKGVDQYVNFIIPSSWITKTERDAQSAYSLNIAKYLATNGATYTQILNQFYQVKTEKVNSF